MVVATEQPLFEHRTELAPELEVVAGALLLHLLERAQGLLDELLADRLDLPVLLQHLARDVEREIVRVDHALDEAQVRRQELAALVHDEDALDVQLYAALHLGVVDVEGRAAGDVEERVRLERALHLDGDRAERRGPVVRDVLVELFVLAVGHLRLRAVPDRLHRVEGLVAEADGVRHEVGVALDDVAQDVVARVVAQALLVVVRVQVQGDGGAARLALAVGDRVRAASLGLPERGARLTRAPREQGDLAGDHERRVEPDAELPDELGRRVLALRVFERGEELFGAALGDRADVAHDLVARHADAAVGNGERALFGVDLDADRQLAAAQLGVGHALEAQFVERVGRVRHELAEEDVLVGVEGVDDEVEQLLDLGLELVALGGLAHGGSRRNVKIPGRPSTLLADVGSW